MGRLWGGADASRSRTSDSLFVAAIAALLLAAASAANAAPTARFTATPVQAPVCVAPCAVHLDARATDDPQYTRDFHTLDYEFSCGIAAAGKTPGTWQDGASTDVARGPITGCIYTEPGTYTVNLTVRAPDGETGTASANVVVANPDTEFADANETWCVAASGTPTGPAFAACPNPNAANHVVTASFNGGLASCGVSSAHRRCLFHAGDAFTITGSTTLSNLGGLVGVYGTGAAPSISGTADTALLFGDNWTVTGLHFTLTDSQGACSAQGDYFNFGTAKDGLTLHRVTVDGLSGHAVSTSSGVGPGVTHNDRIALIGVTMNQSPTFDVCAGQVFLRTERTLVMGNVLDGAWRTGGGNTYNFRTVHFPYGAIQHNRIRRPGLSHNNIQLRAWAGSETGPPNDPTQYVVISDNQFSAQDPVTGFIRTCQSNTCDSLGSYYTDIQHVLVERNFFSYETGASSTGAYGIGNFQGGDITVRNNVVDGQGLDFGAGGYTRLAMHVTSSGTGRNEDRFEVFNNTFYSNSAGNRAVRLCDSAAGTSHECHGNLVYAPSDTGSKETTGGAGWSTPLNNVFATANPFAIATFVQGATSPASFELAATSPAKDAGDDFVAVTSYGNVRDNAARCRPVGKDIDAGAREQGAGSCGAGTPPPPPACGDGHVDAGEACDDGNLIAGDGCSATCRIEACGNGVLDAGEACDDGNLIAGDGCNATCRIEACGNGVLDAGEACDDGNRVAGDGCSATCRIEVCGNGIVDPGEACDDGNRVSGDGCSATCRSEACGNGVRDPGEACDDGNTIGGDGCSATCTVEACGNGVLDAGEACDDGNRVAGDGCSATCRIEACGNGVLDAGEACDDGNTIGGDGCRANCTIERCGDGILDGGEECDDGNTVSGDRCSATCTIESQAGGEPYYVDAGGAGYTDNTGKIWISDAPFANGGRVATSSFDVRATTNDALYQTRRFGPTTGTPLTFEFPVTSTGPYRVRLHFAEMDPNVRAGGRVFNVVAENAFTLSNVDVYLRVGAARPYVRDIYVNVGDGSLTLSFVPVVGEPMIAGIEIEKGSPPTSAPKFVKR